MKILQQILYTPVRFALCKACGTHRYLSESPALYSGETPIPLIVVNPSWLCKVCHERATNALSDKMTMPDDFVDGRDPRHVHNPIPRHNFKKPLS